MNYQEPNIELIEWKFEDVITLSVGSDLDDPIIKGLNENNYSFRE